MLVEEEWADGMEIEHRLKEEDIYHRSTKKLYKEWRHGRLVQSRIISSLGARPHSSPLNEYVNTIYP